MYKIIYSLLFLSIDLLLYLKLVRKSTKSGYWLIADILVWCIMLILHLPVLHFRYLMPFNVFMTLSGMILEMTLLYYIGRFAIDRMEKAVLPDVVKEASIGWLNLVFNRVIFIVFFVLHLIYILSWPV